MQTLGLIGGTTWESTILYYKRLNELVQEKFGGVYSAPMILYSVEFNHVLALMKQNQWDTLKTELIKIAKDLEQAGAKSLLICTNTIHKIADDIQKNIKIPIINIIDVIAAEVQKRNIKTIGILGTKLTMEDPFYTNRFKEKYNITSVVPKTADRERLDDIIFGDLARGVIEENAKSFCKRLIDEFEQQGAECVILGCTELPLLISQQDVKLLVIDSLELHINAGFQFMIQNAGNKI